MVPGPFKGYEGFVVDGQEILVMGRMKRYRGLRGASWQVSSTA
jgi:hypothetical protein